MLLSSAPLTLRGGGIKVSIFLHGSQLIRRGRTDQGRSGGARSIAKESKLIPTLECILDRGLAEQIIERSVEVITQDGVLFRQGESEISCTS